MFFEFVLNRNDVSVGVAATITPATGPAVTLGNVFKWKEGYSVKRYDERRDHRDRSAGTIVASGEFLGNLTQTLSARSAALRTLKEQLMTGLNQKNGRLQFGAFDKIVRFDSFEAEIDQETEKMAWSFSASYTRFPNESGYAGWEYEVNNKQNNEDGDLSLTFSGRILAENFVTRHGQVGCRADGSAGGQLFHPLPPHPHGNEKQKYFIIIVQWIDRRGGWGFVYRIIF